MKNKGNETGISAKLTGKVDWCISEFLDKSFKSYREKQRDEKLVYYAGKSRGEGKEGFSDGIYRQLMSYAQWNILKKKEEII